MKQLKAKVFFNPTKNTIDIAIDHDISTRINADDKANHLFCKLKELQNQGYKISFGM